MTTPAVVSDSAEPLRSLPVASQAETLRHAATAIRPHRTKLLFVVLLQLAAACFAAVIPWNIGQLIDHLATGQLSTSHGLRVAGIIVGCAAVSATLLAVCSIRGAAVGEAVAAETREQFMEHTLRIPLSAVEQVGTGSLTSRANMDVFQINHSIREFLPRSLVAIATLLVMLCAAVTTGGWAGLAVLIIVPPLAIFIRWFLPRWQHGYAREANAYDRFNTITTETLNSLRTIDAQNLAPARAKTAGDALRWAFCAERHNMHLMKQHFAVIEFAILGTIAVTIAVGAPLVVNGVASIGQIATVAMYLLSMGPPINALIWALGQLSVGVVSLSRLIGIASIADDRAPGNALPSNNVVSLTDVSFGYTSDRPVLHDVSLTITAGQRVTIVGPSGSGKSTLGRLIGGVNPPATGAVCLGGIPIVELPADELHQRICLLTQEYHVFSATIADNLRLATPEATDDDLWAAIQTVGATDAIAALPDGLATMVGSGHLGLDPALAQQLALARIILADPDVIILDEATSLLDPRAARTMEHALNQVLAGRTVIAIAHRLHTAHDADRILVMNDGHVIEDGTHDELLAADGDYATLWHTWQTGTA